MGSAAPNCCNKGAAEDCRPRSKRCMSSRSAATENDFRVVVRDSRYRWPNRTRCSAEPSRSRPPLLTKTNCPERSSAPVISRLIRARTSAGRAFDAEDDQAGAAPERNCSSIMRAASLRPRGRKSVMSVRISMWLNTSPAEERRNGECGCDRAAPPVTR